MKEEVRMSEEIQQAVQIIRVAYDGVEIAMKIGSASLEQMKQAIDFLVALLEHEKTIGKTNMRKLLLKGGDLQVLQFASEDMKQVKKMAKKYGLLYSVIPDKNKKDGMREIIFHTEAVPRVNLMVQKLKSARIADFHTYLKDNQQSEVEKRASSSKENEKEVLDEKGVDEDVELIEKIGTYICEKQNVQTEDIKEHFSITTEQIEKVTAQLKQMGVLQLIEKNEYQVLMKTEDFLEHMKKYQELVYRIQQISAMQKGSLVDVTITKKLILEENDHAIKTRIPGKWGTSEGYLWIKKENAINIRDGKTILTVLDMDKDYKIYSEDNRVLRTMKGSELYENHYDKVEAEVRKRYEQAQRKTIVKEKRKVVTPKKR